MTIVKKDETAGILELGSQCRKKDGDDAAATVPPLSLKKNEEQPSIMMMMTTHGMMTTYEHHHQGPTIKISGTKDTEESLCSICLDSFDMGDVVMWSPQRSRCC
jgi:hypothetical protein